MALNSCILPLNAHTLFLFESYIFSNSVNALQQTDRLSGFDLLPRLDDRHFGLVGLHRHILHPARVHLLRLDRHHVRLRHQNVLGCIQVK